MRRALVFLLVAVLLPWGVAAQEPAQAAADPHPGVPFAPPDIPPGNDVRVVLRLRDPAPFEGILFDPTTLVRWTNRIQWLEHRLHLEHELHVTAEDAARAAYERELATVSGSYEREAAQARGELERTRQDLDAARAHVARLERRPWYRSFGFGMGLGAGLVLTAGILGFMAGR